MQCFLMRLFLENFNFAHVLQMINKKEEGGYRQFCKYEHFINFYFIPNLGIIIFQTNQMMDRNYRYYCLLLLVGLRVRPKHHNILTLSATLRERH